MWITVFKAGTHVNMSGVEQNYTEADLKEIANTYNNQPEKDRHTAPLIPGGHEKVHFSDGEVMIKPSMGWVEQLKVSGQNLLAKIDPTQKFTEAVKGKYYNKLSISLKANKLLDHIALLGAEKPAVKGLPNLDSSFTMNIKELADVESYEFSEVEPSPNTDGLKPKDNFEDPKPNLNNNQKGEIMLITLDTAKLIDWVKSEFGDETATKLQEKLPEFEAPKEEPKNEEPKEGEGSTPPTPPAENFSEKDDNEKSKLLSRIAFLEAENRQSKFSEFVANTHIPGGLKTTALNVLEIAHNAETSNFSVKDEKGIASTPVNVMKSLLKSWPQAVSLGEDTEVNGNNFSEPGLKDEIDSATESFNKRRQ